MVQLRAFFSADLACVNKASLFNNGAFQLFIQVQILVSNSILLSSVASCPFCTIEFCDPDTTDVAIDLAISKLEISS